MATKRERDERDRRRAGSGDRDSRHRGGGMSCLNIPTGVEMFQPEAKTYRLELVLYQVGKDNPYCRDTGAWYYELTYWMHGRVGPNGEPYCCPAKNFRQFAGENRPGPHPCPICEYRNKLERQGRPKDVGEKEWKSQIGAYRPKERQLWLVHLRGQGDDKVLLWDFSHYNFGRLLDVIRKGASEDQPHKRDYDDPEGGAVLDVSFAEKQGDGYKYLECYAIEFTPRPKGLNPALLEHGINLEAVPIIPSYEDLKRVFFQEADAEDDADQQEEKPKGRSRPAADDDDGDVGPQERNPIKASDLGIKVNDKVKHREFGVCTVVKISSDGTSLTLEDSDEEYHKAVAVDDVRLVKEDKPEPKKEPTKEPTKASPKNDDDWDVDEPPPKKEPPKPKTKPVDPDDDWDSDPPSKAKAKKEPAKVATDDDDWDA